MRKSKIRHRDRVAICDGRKALILQNEGDEEYPNLREYEKREQKQALSRQLGSDRPGRVHEAPWNRSIFHEEAEGIFIAELAAHLHSAINNRPEQQIVIIAPPRASWMVPRSLFVRGTRFHRVRAKQRLGQ